MKKAKIIFWQSFVGLIPALYFLSIWNSLSDNVPTHYNFQFVADNFGTKFEMLGILLFILAGSIGTSLLVINLNKFDPKQRYVTVNPIFIKISWTVVIFLTLISVFIVYETENYNKTNTSNFSPKYIVALVSLLFVVLGNYMNNIKQNYFVGIRTPWSLENEENWRRTHHLGAKIWFFGGLLMFVLILFLPQSFALYIIIGGIIPLTVIPIWYSYNLFRQKQRHG